MLRANMCCHQCLPRQLQNFGCRWNTLTTRQTRRMAVARLPFCMILYVLLGGVQPQMAGSLVFGPVRFSQQQPTLPVLSGVCEEWLPMFCRCHRMQVSVLRRQSCIGNICSGGKWWVYKTADYVLHRAVPGGVGSCEHGVGRDVRKLGIFQAHPVHIPALCKPKHALLELAEKLDLLQSINHEPLIIIRFVKRSLNQWCS